DSLAQHVRLIGLSCDDGFALVGILLNGIVDGVVQTAVQGTKLVGLDSLAALERQIGDRLAQVAIVVHNLIDAKTTAQQVAPVLGSRGRDLREARLCAVCRARNLPAPHGLGALLELERFDELAQEYGYALAEFGGVGPGRGP